MLVWTHTRATLNIDFYPSTHTIPTFYSLNTHDSYLKTLIWALWCFIGEILEELGIRALCSIIELQH